MRRLGANYRGFLKTPEKFAAIPTASRIIFSQSQALIAALAIPAPGFYARQAIGAFQAGGSGRDNIGALTDAELSSPAAVPFVGHCCCSATAGGSEGAATVGDDWETAP